MSLKMILDSIDGLVPEIASMYKKDDASGKYKLQVDGMVPRDSLDEFRNNNIELKKQLQQYTDAGLTVEEAIKAKKLADDLRDKKFIEAGDIEGLVAERVKPIVSEANQKVEQLNSQLAKANESLSVLMIDNNVRAVASKSGVVSTAVDDVLLRARSMFTIDDGKVVAKQEGKIIYGKDGVTPLSVDEYISGLTKTAPHLFASSEGTGARGGKGPGSQGTEGLTANQKIAKGLESRA